MIALDFKGPFRYDEFLKKESDKANHAGIYIWGFNHPDNGMFIPYYVGKAENSVLHRIGQHFNKINDLQDNTYKWLTSDYLFGLNNVKPFYSDPKFPNFCESPLFKGKQKLPLWYRNQVPYFDDKFVYLNNYEFLQRKKPDIIKSDDYPMALLEISEKKLIPYKSQLRFCYATVRNEDKQELFFDYLEAFTRFMLKGKTISNSLNFGDVHYLKNSLYISVVLHNNVAVNKLAYLFKKRLSLIFPGY